MWLLSIQCCFLFICFHPLVVQSRPIPSGKDKHGAKHKYDAHNMYTDPTNPFYPGYIETSRAWKIFWKIAVRNFKSFWRRYTYQWNAPYGHAAPTYGYPAQPYAPSAPPYGATAPHYGTHVAGAPAVPYAAQVPYGAQGNGHH